MDCQDDSGCPCGASLPVVPSGAPAGAVIFCDECGQPYGVDVDDGDLDERFRVLSDMPVGGRWDDKQFAAWGAAEREARALEFATHGARYAIARAVSRREAAGLTDPQTVRALELAGVEFLQTERAVRFHDWTAARAWPQRR